MAKKAHALAAARASTHLEYRKLPQWMHPQNHAPSQLMALDLEIALHPLVLQLRRTLALALIIVVLGATMSLPLVRPHRRPSEPKLASESPPISTAGVVQVTRGRCAQTV